MNALHMNALHSRRRFLRHAGATALLTSSVGGMAGAGWPACSVSASLSEPIPRNGTAKFKFSLAAYSYRSLLQGKSPQFDLFQFIDDCARFGLEGTELTSYYFPAEIKPQYLRQLKRHAFRLGLSISGTAVRNDFGTKDPAKRLQDIEHVKRWIEYAEILGAPVIRVFAGHVPRDGSADEAHRRIVSGLEECCAYAGEHGVHLALENHGGPTATVDGLLKLVKDVQSPWFGVNLDTGNFHSSDVYGDLAKAAPYALNVQVKVVTHDDQNQKRPTDYSRLAKILTDAGYRGFVVLEYEEAGDPRTESAAALKQLRSAFAAD